MDRRRMMMGGGGKCVVALSFSKDTASGTYVEYKGLQNRTGEFKCKKNDVIKCVLAHSPGAPASIYLDGTAVASDLWNDVVYEMKVETNLSIEANGARNAAMYITTEK